MDAPVREGQAVPQQPLAAAAEPIDVLLDRALGPLVLRDVAHGDEVEIEFGEGDLGERRCAFAGVAAAPEPLAEPDAEGRGPSLPIDVEPAEAGDLARAVLALAGPNDVARRLTVLEAVAAAFEELQRLFFVLVGVPRDVLGHLVDPGVRRADPVARVEVDVLRAPWLQPESFGLDRLGEHTRSFRRGI